MLLEESKNLATRLFLAIPISGGAASTLLDNKQDLPGVRWSNASSVHLTLRFLGDVEASKIPDLARSLEQAAQLDGFVLRIKGLGLFERSVQAVFWAGVERNQALLGLKHKIDQAVSESLGLPKDKPHFSPHITLARLKTPEVFKQSLDTLRALANERASHCFFNLEVSGFTLFKSRLTPQGAVHTPVQEYLLS